MEPSEKSPQINRAINEIFGFDREETIRQSRCVPPPIGCGQVVNGFKDAISEKEYSISGLCQTCQDDFFGS